MRLHIAVAVACLLFSLGALSQTRNAPTPSKSKAAPRSIPDRRSTKPRKQELDTHIVAALRDVSPARIRADIDKLVGFYTRSTLSVNDPALAQQGRGIVAARQWIQSEFESYSKDCGGCLEVKTESYVQEPAERIKVPTEITDVYAVLRGSDSANADRIVLVTGHYDSRNSDNFDITHAAPGANDDASGTAVSLECARVLSKHKFPATIIFLTVAGEEQGLYGSKHFAEVAKKNNWQIEAVLNNDIVGGDRNRQQDPLIVRVFSEGLPIAADAQQTRLIRGLGEESDSPSRELARYVRDIGEQYLAGPFGPKLVFRPDRYLRGGDHESFNEQGYAAVRFTEYREDFNHQHQTPRTEKGIEYGDLPKFVDFDYVANVARLNAAVLASLASAPAPPANVRLLTRDLENDSTLTWDASSGGLAGGYEVLWRPTTSPFWENVEPQGDATRATLKRSKDNVYFAVRAVDNRGHRSLPVVPVPER